MQADIQNAYLDAPCDERIWTILGPEFGPELSGKRALVKRALYGLKSAVTSHRNHLASGLRHVGFKSCKADPDAWMRPAVKSKGGVAVEVYEYILVYTDDLLVILVEPKTSLKTSSSSRTQFWNQISIWV